MGFARVVDRAEPGFALAGVAEHEVTAAHGAVAGDTGNDGVMRKQLHHLFGYPHAIVQQHDGNPCRQLACQGRQGRHHLTRLGHNQQSLDGAGLVDEAPLDGEQLGVALEGGEIDAGVQGGAVPLAQQDTGRLATLGQQGGEDAAQGTTAQQGPVRGGGVSAVFQVVVA
ncbi:hypothetical protein D3C85_594900 [compost metagenome]